MNKKVIYFDFHGERHRVIRSLYEKYDWEPVYISGLIDDTLKKYIKTKHPDCIHHQSMKLRQAQFNYEELGYQTPIDSGQIDVISKYALNVLGFMQDTSGWNYSFDERKSFYFDILKYWNTVIHKFEPDLIVFYTWPHTSSCYPLYLLAKHYFKINILFIDPTPLFNKNYHFIGTSIEELYAPFIEKYISSDEYELNDDVLNYIEKLRAEKAKIPKYIEDVYLRDKKVSGNYVRKLLRLLISTIKNGVAFKSDFEFKKNARDYKNIKSRLNHLDNIIFTETTRQNNIKLKKIYKKYCQEPDYNNKYIYFAAPYQPEAVTAINAGVYEDIFLVLDILSESIPEDYVIYYKEHPAIFLGHFRGSLKRNDSFYKKLLEYKNIVIVPSEIDTFKLIDNSKAVSTIGGSVGWEAIIRSKPAMIFGNVWYQKCKSVLYIETISDAKKAIDKIEKGFLPEKNDVEKYAAAVLSKCKKGIVHDNYFENIKSVKDINYEMNRIADMFYEAESADYG